MRRAFHLTLTSTLLVAALWGGAAQAASDGLQRLALVVGNARLGSQRVLDPAPRDVRAVAAALREAGFLVMQREDLGADALRADLDEFRSRLAAGGVGFIYISTLGAQLDGQTLLLMRDTRLPDADDASPAQVAAALRRDAVELVEVLHALSGPSAATPANGPTRGPRALVLDAAWRHPLLDRLPLPGLAEPTLPPGVIALSSQANGQVQLVPLVGTLPASTGAAAPPPRELAATPLARQLVARFATPGLSATAALRAVRQDLIDSTQGRVTPWLGGSTDEQVSFAEPRPAVAVAAASAAPPDTRTRPAGERGERPVFEPRRNAFGHAEGDTLSFRVIDRLKSDEGEERGTEVVAIEAITAAGGLSANGAALLLDAQGRITRQPRRDGGTSTFSPALDIWWAAPARGQVRQLAFAEAIEGPGGGTRSSADWAGSAEVGAPRLLELPAGSFEVLPITSSGTVSEALPGGARVQRKWSRTAWYAPKLGQPVAIDSEDFDAGGKLLRRERIELVHAQTARDAR